MRMRFPEGGHDTTNLLWMAERYLQHNAYPATEKDIRQFAHSLEVWAKVPQPLDPMSLGAYLGSQLATWGVFSSRIPQWEWDARLRGLEDLVRKLNDYYARFMLNVYEEEPALEMAASYTSMEFNLSEEIEE
jgi:hypothetical protein